MLWGMINQPKANKPTIKERLNDVKFANRFLSKFDIPDDYVNDCWVWKLKPTSTTGYGRLDDTNASYSAHRISLEYYKGNLDSNLVIDHLCRNRICINPWHLEQVTNEENIKRGESSIAENKYKTHCPQNHEYTEENTYRDKKSKRYCKKCSKERRSRNRLAKQNKAAPKGAAIVITTEP